VLGSVAIFAELSALPEQLGVFQLMERHFHENHDYAFLSLPLGLLFLFGPIYATAWFFQWCCRMTYPLPASGKRPKTQATRSLIWLGVLCVILPPIVAMLIFFNHMTQSPIASIVSESMSNSLRWITGLSVIGFLLMFLGLVRRRPVPTEASIP
jgi:ACR3 family arsenite efflux pump ArsB